eukprot:Transcript_6498.p4 GENE.Transcript_6498~~Transcript_6498.p4  ORF type:complete len:96 (+),score=4.71 Transcript_6498:396-683(+)
MSPSTAACMLPSGPAQHSTRAHTQTARRLNARLAPREREGHDAPRRASPGPNITQKEVLIRQIISKPIAHTETTSQAPFSQTFVCSGMATMMMPL